MRLALIPFLLLVIPVMEIAAFIVIGQQIGLFPTLGMIVVTAIIGSILLRIQGFQILGQLKPESEAGRLPGRALGDGAMILVAGVLLLTPGFVTDTLGFLLFVPAVRGGIWSFLAKRITVAATGFAGFSGQSTDHPPFGGNAFGQASAGQGPVVDLDASDYSVHPTKDDRNAPRPNNASRR